jgi:hypothetical protein
MYALEEQVHVPHYHWSHSGPLDTFDKARFVNETILEADRDCF